MRASNGRPLRQKVTSYEGSGSVMLTAGHVNKNHASPEPRNNREPFATRHRRDLVHCLGRERDQQTLFTENRNWIGSTGWHVVFVVKVQRAAAVAVLLWLNGVVVQKHDHRDAADAQVIEFEHVRIAILVANEEVSRFITEKLGLLAVSQRLSEVRFDC